MQFHWVISNRYQWDTKTPNLYNISLSVNSAWLLTSCPLVMLCDKQLQELKLFFSFFFFWLYSPRWILVSTKITLHCSRSCYWRLQFLTLMFFRSSPTDSGHLNLGFPTRRVPSVSRSVSFLEGSSSCILKSFPSHFVLPIFIILTIPS
jgi:hypothetical protein